MPYSPMKKSCIKMYDKKGKQTGLMMEGSVAHMETMEQKNKNLMEDMPADNKVSAVEMSPYDSATKMVSPLGMHHRYKAPELNPDFRNPGGNTNMTKTLTEKPKKTTGLRKFANILTGGLSEVATEVAEHVKDYNYTPPKTFTKVKTDIPKKRVNGGNLGYVINVNTGKRHPTETSPYDSATKMKSPSNDNHPGDKKMLKTLTDKPRVTTAYNSSYTGNPDVSNRVYNAATGLTINEDPTYNYKKASQYEANAVRQYGSLEAARKALYNKRNKTK